MVAAQPVTFDFYAPAWLGQASSNSIGHMQQLETWCIWFGGSEVSDFLDVGS